MHDSLITAVTEVLRICCERWKAFSHGLWRGIYDDEYSFEVAGENAHHLKSVGRKSDVHFL